MKRRPLLNQECFAFLLVFAICSVSVCLVQCADVSGASKTRRFNKNFSSESNGSQEPAVAQETVYREEILVDVGETVYIGCSMNRTSTYSCEWFKRGPQGGNKKRITQFFDRYQRITPCQLQIRSVSQEDEGIIICKALTDSSEPTFHAYQLKVTGHDDPLENVLPKPWNKNSRSPVIYAEPEIVMEAFTHDRMYNVQNGANIVLKCEAKGNPKPFVIWRRGSKNYTTLAEGYSILKLKNLTKDDSGVYKCEAINMFGKVATTITIKVQAELQGASEIIEVTPRNVSLYEGHQGNVTCIARFEGDPWFVWVKTIENRTSETNVFTHEGQHYSVLPKTEIRPLGQNLYSTTMLLQNVTVASSGVYHCIVAGLQGYNHSAVYVTVERDPASLHAPTGKHHRTIAVMWILGFLAFAVFSALLFVRVCGCPNNVKKKSKSQTTSASEKSTSRKTSPPKPSPDTLSTDTSNPHLEVFLPLVTQIPSCVTSPEHSHWIKKDYDPCPSYSNVCEIGTFSRNSGRSSHTGSISNGSMIDLDRRLGSRQAAPSLVSEFYYTDIESEQSEQAPSPNPTQTSDYFTNSNNPNTNTSTSQSPPPGSHTRLHKHRHHHHHVYHKVPSKTQQQSEIRCHFNFEAPHQFCYTQESAGSCPSESFDEDFRQSSSDLSVNCEEPRWHSRSTKVPQRYHHRHRSSHDREKRSRSDDDGPRSGVANDRRKVNPSSNHSLHEHIGLHPNVVHL